MDERTLPELRRPPVIRDTLGDDTERTPKLVHAYNWMCDHREELKPFAGQFIAIHPERGFVAAADVYDALEAGVSCLGLVMDDVVVDMP